MIHELWLFHKSKVDSILWNYKITCIKRLKEKIKINFWFLIDIAKVFNIQCNATTVWDKTFKIIYKQYNFPHFKNLKMN